ncbi:ribose utilization transcriptional repressor RbsR [Paucilactobacillus nenjiangensis]|jgi:LacI family transcriptional regulator|uniref:LacI family transcriptional regulator n=1 Tax=Paucilactobacillus nenjiangensis TaxID=1296540 RepID=A0A5P1X3C0_9LACO|nr:LacI family DNA-binding transcriptional regulator [Paucilactobacillus nenjiangensis]QER66951.1 LacI family transcriptional regulator [Paucilactobacillus nenjiangensis]
MVRKVTINDLAQAAGTSVTTVSQILNGKGDRFSADTRKRVLNLKVEMNYVPDFNARNLIMKSAQTIGVLVPNVGNPFFSELIKGIQTIARENQFIPIIFSSNHDAELEKYYLEKLVERSVSGLIIASAAITAEVIDEILNPNNIKYLLIDENTVEAGDTVQTDDYHGGQLAAQHLIDLHHKKIAMIISDSLTNNLRRRLQGFEDVCIKNDIDLKTDIVKIASPMTKRGGYEAVTELVKHPEVTAVFTINDEMAVGVYRGLRERKIDIPNDLSVIGYDGIEWGEYFSPKLTTIRQPIIELGKKSAEVLLNRVNNPKVKTQTVNLPVELVARESTTQNTK